MSLETEILHRLTSVRQRVAQAADRARRAPGDIRLIAVSKTFPVEYVRAAIAADQVDFGENRVQEAVGKVQAAGPGPEWHLIGHLQSNKVRKAAATFAWIHSIDSADLLRKVDAAALEAGASPRVLVQVDMAGEPTKHGARPQEVEAIFAAADGCQAARLAGLMLLPPFFDDAERARPFFRELAALRDALSRRGVPASALAHLSMGMSHDFEVAIEEGATMVRVGTAIFGTRAARQ